MTGILFLLLAFLSALQAQPPLRMAQYTSKQGLPQNSVNSMAFDQHGFLWVATQGGIARFDGQHFRTIHNEDHTDLKNQRFSHVLRCNDTILLFIDASAGMYLLSNNRFNTIHQEGYPQQSIMQIKGSPPNPFLLSLDTFFRGQVLGNWPTTCSQIAIFPAYGNKVFVVTKQVKMLDVERKECQILPIEGVCGEEIACLNGQILRFDDRGQLSRLQTNNNTFEKCALIDEAGKPWTKPIVNASIYSQYPYDHVFITDDQKLYTLLPTNDRRQFMLSTILHELPEKCVINSVAYRQADATLVLGTDSRGLFVYQQQYYKTFTTENAIPPWNNVYYAQSLLDSKTLLISAGMEVDLPAFKFKGLFRHTINPFQMCN
ncbi:MAG: two-component regulator propeller domain-containing protein, partial [Saprospiraceae bacterium]